MNNYKMVFLPKKDKEIDSEKAADLIDWLITALHKNGQIIPSYDITKKGKKYFAGIVCPDIKGLNEKYDNEYVNKYYTELREFFDIRIVSNGYNLEFSAICKCKSPSWYYLLNPPFSANSPVICGDCDLSVPLFRLPHLDKDKEYSSIESWKQGYKGVDNLWFYGRYDAFAYRQMSNPKSKLSKDGIRVCRDYEKAMKKPFYYYLNYYEKDFISDICGVKCVQTDGVCPICGKAWERIDSGYADFRCLECRLIANDVTIKEESKED